MKSQTESGDGRRSFARSQHEDEFNSVTSKELLLNER